MEVRKPGTNTHNTKAHRPLSRHQETTDKIPTHASTATLKFRAPPRQSAAPPEQIADPPLEELCQILLPPQPRHLRTTTQSTPRNPIKEPPPKTIRKVPLHQTQTHRGLHRAHRNPSMLRPARQHRHLLAPRPPPRVMPQREGLCLGLPHARRRRQAAPPAGRHLCPRRGAAGRARQHPRRARHRRREAAHLCRALHGRRARQGGT